MKSFRVLTSILLLTAASSAFAQTGAKTHNMDIEQKNREALHKYSQETGKPVPAVVDYSYGMDLDVNKIIYMTQGVAFCGTINKIMSFEDDQGNPQSVRYVDKGECRNRR